MAAPSHRPPEARMTTDPVKVLCVVDYYFPGFKGGGPLRTIANMRPLLAGEIELAVFTRDRDLGADTPYDGFPADCWIQTATGPMYYASPDMRSKSVSFCLERLSRLATVFSRILIGLKRDVPSRGGE